VCGNIRCLFPAFANFFREQMTEMAKAPQAPGQAERPFEAGVRIERPRKISAEFGCAALFYLSMVVQLVLAITILSSKNADVESFTTGCPSGYTPAHECSNTDGHTVGVGMCVSSALCQDIEACASNAPPSGFTNVLGGNARRLSSIPADTWQFLEEHWYQPTLLFLCSFILASLWLVALQRFTQVVVWGTIVADVLLLVGIFIWFLAEGWPINWPCIVGVVAIVAASAYYRKKVNAAADMMNIAMNGLFDNMRVFGVCFGVQMVWVAFFAIWIASLLGMHFVKEVKLVTDGGWSRCELSAPWWLDSGALITFWMLQYSWVTFFLQNVNLIIITQTLAGWYFNEDGYKHFWMPALKWSVGALAGGNAICSAIMGIGEYLMSKIGSCWSLFFAVLNPFDWLFICLALVTKTLIQTYTKFGLIAHAYGGRPFCETAPRAFQVLKQWLGEAVITDFLGKRIMSWCTYLVALLVTYVAWVWGCQVQSLTSGSLNLGLFIGLVVLWVYLLSYPFLGLVAVVLFEQYAGSNFDGETRGYMNAFLAAQFMGSITYFVLKFLSQVVVSAMDVALFCYAVEKDIGQQQDERFATLYDAIKMTVTTGVAQGNSSSEVVVGTAVPAAVPPHAPAVAPAPTAINVIGQPVNSEANMNKANEEV
jgi:hypothetical protein